MENDGILRFSTKKLYNMKKKTFFMVNRPLADMHVDGVRFDPKVKQALIQARASKSLDDQNQNYAE